MNILILGSGGREHTLAWKISQSALTNNLFIAPGNAGTDSIGKNIALKVSDFSSIKEFAVKNEINMIVVGPEDPLANGIFDYFATDPLTQHISVIGPSAKGALLESSKDFAKEFMFRNNIPTARYKTFTKNEFDEAVDFIQTLHPPFVLKADGLAAGKGVIICNTLEEAISTLNKMLLEEKFGTASHKVLIEEFLDGTELSVFIITDGKNYVMLPSAKDYKRIGEGNTGLNTGGMGSVSPVPFADKALMDKIEKSIIIPTVRGLDKENITYQGFLYFGLMNVNGNPFVIEYNVRMGDPETQSVLPRLNSDLVEIFSKIPNKELENFELSLNNNYCTSIVMASGGYPETYEKHKVITGLKKDLSCRVFHAGTVWDPESKEIVTSGGRVLAVTAMGDSLEGALQKVYECAGKIHFDDAYYRKDIGKDLLTGQEL